MRKTSATYIRVKRLCSSKKPPRSTSTIGRTKNARKNRRISPWMAVNVAFRDMLPVSLCYGCPGVLVALL